MATTHADAKDGALGYSLSVYGTVAGNTPHRPAPRSAPIPALAASLLP